MWFSLVCVFCSKRVQTPVLYCLKAEKKAVWVWKYRRVFLLLFIKVIECNFQRSVLLDQIKNWSSLCPWKKHVSPVMRKWKNVQFQWIKCWNFTELNYLFPPFKPTILLMILLFCTVLQIISFNLKTEVLLLSSGVSMPNPLVHIDAIMQITLKNIKAKTYFCLSCRYI